MKDIKIKITKSTRYVDFENDNEKVGNIGENLQTMLVFSFTDEFVNGQARLEYTINGESQYVFMQKVGETYQTPVTSQLAQCGSVDLQLVITEGTDENEIPKFKSNVFYLPFGKSINAEVEQAEGYEEWIDIANTKLNQLDEGLVEIETQSAYAKEQGDYAKQEATKVDEIVDYVVKTSNEANEKSDTAISIAKGANQALDYLDYANMIANFNAFEKDKFMTGQQIMIKKLNVPDVWIYQLTNEYQYYTYTTDEEVIDLLLSDNGFHVGYYVLSALETQKVDLTGYVKNTDIPSKTKAGPVKIDPNYGTAMNGDTIVINAATNSMIDSKDNGRCPIVPSRINYMFEKQMPTLTQDEYDELVKAGTIDENLIYQIVEE